MFLFDFGGQKLGAEAFPAPCMTANGVSSIISLFRLLGFARIGFRS
jgi:hypothetical protein